MTLWNAVHNAFFPFWAYKCFTWRYFFPCVKNLVSVCSSDICVYLSIKQGSDIRSQVVTGDKLIPGLSWRAYSCPPVIGSQEQTAIPGLNTLIDTRSVYKCTVLKSRILEEKPQILFRLTVTWSFAVFSIRQYMSHPALNDIYDLDYKVLPNNYLLNVTLTCPKTFDKLK